MVQSKRQREKRYLVELDNVIKASMPMPGVETASVQPRDDVKQDDAKSIVLNQEVDDVSLHVVGSVNSLISSHVEQGTDIREFFGAICPVHNNNWECLDQTPVS